MHVEPEVDLGLNSKCFPKGKRKFLNIGSKDK